MRTSTVELETLSRSQTAEVVRDLLGVEALQDSLVDEVFRLSEGMPS